MATYDQIVTKAESLGLRTYVNRPGDGARRYQFHQPSGGKSPVLKGAWQAAVWLDGFELGKTSHDKALIECIKNLHRTFSSEWYGGRLEHVRRVKALAVAHKLLLLLGEG